ncbi:translesion DNA synthesis-associated protein ImuA [Rhodoferax sp.]|uniref:translesion DNA synthesis-associated protein ImuA n=1 Tax=Rhodoferax sp. TaxID=50421 RepID=UPI002841360D|nr:translesion DNA synthesis-associated protein ImuA [Rhodoferax sp.]MDR3370046.1 translesion DNA synthesis-associated protein ImuA [Rhodoferax sp.]
MAVRSVSTLIDTLGDAVWCADALAHTASTDGAALSSGHVALDAQLPGGGWPVGALCEILQPTHSQNEWRLLLPALRTLTQTILLVGAPYAPFGPGLAGQGLDVRNLLWVQANALSQRLWVTEQALRCADVAAVLAWLPQVRAHALRSDHLRRLHLAAQTQSKLLWVLRESTAKDESSPAVLRLLVAQAPDDALAVAVLKRRGPPLAQTLYLPARHAMLGALLAVGPTTFEQNHALDRLAAAA